MIELIDNIYLVRKQMTNRFTSPSCVALELDPTTSLCPIISDPNGKE